MEQLSQILDQFSPISLEDMDSVRLLDRMDTKFTFSIDKLHAILLELKGRYSVLNINGIILNRYETLYFDSPEFLLYHQHHNGKLNRFKVRMRRYVDSDQNYFEVKFKNNKGRTIKDRVKRKKFNGLINEKSAALLEGKTNIDIGNLTPMLLITFIRMTFVDTDRTERITIDIDLNFKNEHREKSYSGLVIAEIKQNRTSKSYFADMMKKFSVARMSVSKYCLGVVSLNDHVKKNNFKGKLIRINKILNHVN